MNELTKDDHGQVIIEIMPRYRAVKRRLDRVLGPSGYGFYYEVKSSGTHKTAICHLRIGPSWRSGVNRYYRHDVGSKIAFSRAAEAFEIGWQAQKVGWVTVDWPVRLQNLPDEVVKTLRGEGVTPPVINAPLAGDEQGDPASEER